MGLLEGLGRLNYYEIILDIAALVAIVLVPVVVLRYRGFLERRRVKDLQANLWDDHAIDHYILLFEGGGVKRERGRKGLDKAIENEFFRVHDFQNYLAPLSFLSVAA